MKNKKEKVSFFNLANTISIIRITLLPIYLIFLIYGNIILKKTAILLCITIFLLDYLDGWAAKKYNIKTTTGSYLDVIGDRITELVMWLTFLSSDLIPLWAPLIVLSRSMITDLIRAQALTYRKGTYEMIETKTGKKIVNSRIMRGLMGSSKMILFTLLTASMTIYTQEILSITPYLITAVVTLNIIRGIPVVYEGKKYLR